MECSFSFEGGPPELRIELDRAMADGLGVDLATISRVLQASLDGRDVTMLSTGMKSVRSRCVSDDLPEDLGASYFRQTAGVRWR
ncbi:MAG: hypothetical protein Ct9H300mP8_01610 [Gammaproteobacteria bacterium]|nr:MAG: hypothetical protein Ct9H300mP8_01610 [Gammaproteobacteria bacterium]